ncbi:MAG: chloride channel protein [Alloprevotella sp.]|nr:chloride channel protein [Alloprevotella sp.]
MASRPRAFTSLTVGKLSDKKSPSAWFLDHTSVRQQQLLLAVATGLCAGLAAQLLKWLIEEIKFLLTSQFDVTRAQWLFLVYPFVGILLSALFIRYVVRDNIAHGITKILYSLSRSKGNIRAHNTWSSLIASALTIGFGGSVGAESPIVLTGSAIGSNLGKIFRFDHKRQMLLIGCGAAAATAGIFKAPIAGVLFALEVLMIDLTMSSLLPLLLAALTATCVAYVVSGTDALFDFHVQSAFSISQVPGTLLLGIVCGLLALYTMRLMARTERVFSRVESLLPKVLFGGAVLAVLIYLFPPLYGEGYDTVQTIIVSGARSDVNTVLNNSLFYGRPELLLLFLGLVILAKPLATSATNGGGGCGGTFAPSLFLGCIAGYVFCCLWNHFGVLGLHLSERNYALLGMAGMMSGFFHAPLTGVFLIAELTGGYDLFLPLMIVSAAAYLTIHIFEPHNIYAVRLARQGNLLTHDKDRSILTLMSLDAIIEKESPRLAPDMELGKMVQAVSRDEHEDFAVTDAAGHLLGIVNLRSVRRFIFRSELYRLYRVEQLMQPPAAELTTTEQMSSVMDKFQRTRAEVLPVLSADRRFVGFVTRTRLLDSYRQILRDFSEE